MLHQMPRAAAPAPEISEGPSATVALAELRLAANRLARVIERRNTIPALGCVRIRFNGDRLTLEATDLKMTLMLDLEAQTSGRADLVGVASGAGGLPAGRPGAGPRSPICAARITTGCACPTARSR